jgi:hypothetical protein
VKTSDILGFWRDHQHMYPILAMIARDFLAIAASGVGVERLFNSSRDICHYRRSRLAPDTIHAIMVQMCNDRFVLKQDHARIMEDVKTDEDDWDFLLNAGADTLEKGPIYISESEEEMDITEDQLLQTQNVSMF